MKTIRQWFCAVLIAALSATMFAGCASGGKPGTDSPGAESSVGEASRVDPAGSESGENELDTLFQELTLTQDSDDILTVEPAEDTWKESYPDGLCVRFEGFNEAEYAHFLSHPILKQVDPRVSRLGDVWIGKGGQTLIDKYIRNTDPSADVSAKTLYCALRRAALLYSDPALFESIPEDVRHRDVFLVESELYQWDYDGQGEVPYPGYTGPIITSGYYLMRLVPEGEEPDSKNVEYIMFSDYQLVGGGSDVECKQAVEKDGVLVTYDYMTRKYLREFLQDESRYAYLMRDSEYHYEALVDSIYGHTASAMAVELGSKVLKEELTREVYISILYRLLAMQEAGFADCYESMERYYYISQAENLRDHAVDVLTDLSGYLSTQELDPLLPVPMSRNPLKNLSRLYKEELAEFAIDEFEALGDSAEESLTVCTLIYKTGVTNRFLRTLAENTNEPMLKSACEDLIQYNHTTFGAVGDFMKRYGVKSAVGFVNSLWGVDTMELVRGIQTGDSGEAVQGVLKTVQGIGVYALKTLAAFVTDAGEFTYDLCIFAGDAAADTTSQYQSMVSMKAISDIAYALRQAMYPIATRAYQDITPEEMQEFVYLGQLLVIARASGEYCWEQLVTKHGGLAELFNLDNIVAAERYYDEGQQRWRQLYLDFDAIITMDRRTAVTHYEIPWSSGDGSGGGFSGGGGEGDGGGGGGARGNNSGGGGGGR
ncbi:MAG: hypothetical protein IJM90_09070 [Firmicutes bacterium]|nr:hypothetical protein [Bacillota bacterium]